MGRCDFMEKMDANSFLDHGLGQLLWLGCAGRNCWSLGQSAHPGCDLSHEPGKLSLSTILIYLTDFHIQSYNPQRWHQFLIYCGYNIVAFLVNAFMNNLMPYVTKGACEIPYIELSEIFY